MLGLKLNHVGKRGPWYYANLRIALILLIAVVKYVNHLHVKNLSEI